MTTVFVNGNPESAAVWDLLLGELDLTDVVRLSPPGFGSPIPDGFSCTIPGYRDWLVAELEAFSEPVDLVGHDIGGHAVLSVAMARPDLLRSWVCDSLGSLHPRYVWHELAQIWQTPEAGEQAIADRMGAPWEERTRMMIARGVPQPVAGRLAAAQNLEMGRAILSYYRAAVQPVMAERGRELPAAAARPGLAVIATGDEIGGTEEMRRECAALAGAGVAILDGLGHWWMAEDPTAAAEALTKFWAGL